MSRFEPPLGFHFLVVFNFDPLLPEDFRFKEVSGLSVSSSPEKITEGGENRFKHSLPTRPEYSNLVLKRGMFVGSGIIDWCQNAIENFEYDPVDIYVSLLNPKHVAIANWQIVNAYPVKWSISNLNAEENSLVIETIELTYRYFKTLKI